jgi:EAL domain-containing protein (putative c-di-GMP-specific phosphodiesterase class I)
MGVAKPAAAVATDWPGALERACAGRGLHALFQPLVDLQRGLVVGYEALIRFDRFEGVTPDRWFASARIHGCEAELEAAAMATTLAARGDLPPDTFLSINVSPTSLASPPVAQVLDDHGDLRGVVLELTEQTPIDSYDALRVHLDHYRSRGARIAIDDAGSGYSGLSHLLQLRPSILKLDRSLVTGVDRDEAKRILVEMLGVYAGHLDAWVLAEGIETVEELETLRSLGVPLGQGYVLGRPAGPWAGVDDQAVGALRSVRRPPEPGSTVGLLLERAEIVGLPERFPVRARLAGGSADSFVVVVDEHRKPVAALRGAPDPSTVERPVLAVALSTSITDLAFRALTRPAAHRFDPAVATDPAGRALGIVRLERVLESLARSAPTIA